MANVVSADSVTGSITRRDAIKAGITAGAGVILGSSTLLAHDLVHKWADAGSAMKPAKNSGFRFAHLTDIHIQPERKAGEGFTAALQSLHRIDPQPRLLITGGDHVMDSTEQAQARCSVQWDLFDRTMRDHCTLPVHFTMGNHDVAGWGTKEFNPHSPGYGKAMALERLRLSASNYSFEAGGWRFIVLDSITQRGDGYFGWLGDDQMNWLDEELKRIGTRQPICIISHLPVMSVAAYFDGERLHEHNWQVPDSYIHRDMPAIVKLIDPYNVRLLLSGHLHLLDRCEYRGKTYICDGAVCGNWWKGSYHGCPEGYGVIDIWPDGSFEHQYVTYGWNAEPDVPLNK